MPATSPFSRQGALALALAALTVLILWWFGPMVITSHLKLKPAEELILENQLRDTSAKIIWAALTLGLATLAWENLRTLGRVVEQGSQTLAAAERTAFFVAQSGETERYANAMGLLGSPQLEVRIGGAYALERLARESQRDHGPIMEVLAATLRERLMWKDGEAVPARLPADLQAMLTVIGRRHADFDPSEGHIDLHGTALARAYLPWAHLEKAFLYEANLDGAILQNANLRGAWLWKSSMTGAVLEGAHLEGADLTGVGGLTTAQLRTAHTDETTKVPEYLRDGQSGGTAAPTAFTSPSSTPTNAPTAPAAPPQPALLGGEVGDELKLPSIRN